MSKVVRQRFSGVSITSAGTGLVRFIFVHMPDMMCPNMARLELGIVALRNSFLDLYIVYICKSISLLPQQSHFDHMSQENHIKNALVSPNCCFFFN